MAELLEVKNLSVSFHTPRGEVQAVRDVSFSLRPGEVLAIVGESGCGKSALCRSIMKLLPRNAEIRSGTILADGADITRYSQREMERLRGRLFSMVFQDPMTALNPTLTIGAQIAEAVRVHQPKIKKDSLRRRVLELLELVGIAEERYSRYPYDFSGGMRQRAVLAIALASDPKILFADEPTTALDVTIQAQILDLLRDVQALLGTAAVLVTHDLGVVARAADRVAVMYAGKIVETGTAEDIFYDPRHPYTWGLLRSLPAWAKEGDPLYTIPGMPPTLVDPPMGDAFACRNEYALAIDYQEQPPMFQISGTHQAATWLLDERAPKIGGRQAARDGRCAEGTMTSPRESQSDKTNLSNPMNDILLDVENLTHCFRLGRRRLLKAVDSVSFQLRRGEIFGLVGESGSGKSTIAKCVMGLLRPTSGKIRYLGVNICDPGQFRSHKKLLETSRQLIFQDSTSSLDPRMKVSDVITEPMAIHHIRSPRGSLRDEAAFQLKCVGMDASYLDKRPPELSGGQRQRVAIARALSMSPALLVADEPIASLDVSIQAQIINLFRHLQQEHGFTFLFIAHDLAVVRYLCDRVGVMFQGRLVEIAPAGELFTNPLHPYTQALLSAIPIPDPQRERARVLQDFDSDRFDREGVLAEVSPGHLVLRKEVVP